MKRNMNKETEEARQRLKELLDQDPELKKAFKETIEELKKPENIQKMVDATTPYVEAILKLRDKKINEEAESHRKENR